MSSVSLSKWNTDQKTATRGDAVALTRLVNTVPSEADIRITVKALRHMKETASTINLKGQLLHPGA